MNESRPTNLHENLNIISPERAELLKLEASGNYVFHGTGTELEQVEPRQAHTGGKDRIPDGTPAVFASSLADYAIFMAMINRTNFPQRYHSGVGHRRDEKDAMLHFHVDKETSDQLKDTTSGFVHVFNKSDFSLRNEGGVEYVSTKEVKPVKTIKIKRTDFIQKIDIREDIGAESFSTEE